MSNQNSPIFGARSAQAAADVTRITASLPTVDMEIVRHDDSAAGAEAVTITLRARPGFDALAQALMPSAMVFPSLFGAGAGAGPMAAFSPFSSAFSALGGPGSASAGPTAAMQADLMGEAMTQWQKIMEQTWSPWIQGWSTLMAGGMANTGRASNPFADMMAQFSGVPLCSAGSKRK
jgi:hypothetical protein